MNIMPVPVTPPATGTESQAPTPAKVDSAASAQPITPMMGTGKEGSEADLPSGDREKVIDAKSITPGSDLISIDGKTQCWTSRKTKTSG